MSRGPVPRDSQGWERDETPRAFPPEREGDEFEDRGDEPRELDGSFSEERSNLDLAEMIIEKATPRIPADLLLRQTLSRRKRLTRADSAWVSRAVFSYFRWLNWLPANLPIAQRIVGALELADRFAADPRQVPDAELIKRAIPEWTGEQLPVSGPWVRTLQAEPVPWLRARRSSAADVAKLLPGCEPAPFPQFAESFRYRGHEDLFRHELFQAGAFEIQDIASQAVGYVCAPKAGETWWDACAGEGGKMLHLADLMDGKGLIWASDRAAWRLTRLKQRAGRAGCFNYRSASWDGSAKLPTKTLFDGILVDAPCTGLGTWGRNPHSRWTTTQKDVTELAALQKQLLTNAVAALKPGGRLIYAVCTLTRAETLDVAEWFTKEHPELEPLPLANPFAPSQVPNTALTLWPQETQGNGMFIAGWRRPVKLAERAEAPPASGAPAE
jgi:16S rRNA (cytosine967-C5)-methyltransferase